MNLGVIQGCKMGPLLFDIYCNDFKKLLENDNYVLYADDTAMVYVGKDLDELTVHVNNEMEKVSDWCKFNKLSLNPSKSEFMIITNKELNIIPKISINSHEIKCVNSVKYLGIFLDHKLKYQPQIDNIENKLARFCGVSF